MNQVPHIDIAGRQPIYFTDVTPRDGEQQEKIYPEMPARRRIEVFDRIVDTGISRVEIGHLGNEHDCEFARRLVDHIAQKSAAGDARYDNVELQVLFGSQVDLTDGIDALDGFDKDRVFAHVYDRASPELRGLAAEPYSLQQSAKRVTTAALQILDKGYCNFSLSGEGAVDPGVSAHQAAYDFYLPIVAELREHGAKDINVNLPNTFGSALGGEWSEAGLSAFNRYIKQSSPDVSTSIHVHNDHNNAVDYSMAAIRAGFDRVEGTVIGMGERSGNVALSDVMTRLLEDARQVVEVEEKWSSSSMIARMAVFGSIWQERSLDVALLNNVGNWYQSGQAIADRYGVQNFTKTSLGNPAAYDAGSGPHGQANKIALQDPVNHPLWKNYARIALVHAMQGRPEAQQIIAIDPERYREITLNTHAAGGSSRSVIAGEIVECSAEQRQQAIAEAQAMARKIAYVLGGRAVEMTMNSQTAAPVVQLATAGA